MTIDVGFETAGRETFSEALLSELIDRFDGFDFGSC
jgi:hypothetical protein